MKRIEKYEEFKKIWMLYINERATEKDCEYYFKNQLMLMTTDGLVLLLDKKQSIDKDLWYDDETEKPEKTEAFFVRYLTEEETNEILEIQKELTEKYIKRLKNYWKRYNQNIWVRGYWANR